MAPKLKVGDLVIPTDNDVWAKHGPLRVVEVGYCGGVSVLHPVFGRGHFERDKCRLAEPDIGVGDTVLVAFEAKVNYVGDGSYEVELDNGKYRYADLEHVTLVKKAEPVYTPGKLYRDDAGELFVHAPVGDWRHIRRDGLIMYSAEPAFPVHEVVVVAK